MLKKHATYHLVAHIREHHRLAVQRRVQQETLRVQHQRPRPSACQYQMTFPRSLDLTWKVEEEKENFTILIKALSTGRELTP